MKEEKIKLLFWKIFQRFRSDNASAFTIKLTEKTISIIRSFNINN